MLQKNALTITPKNNAHDTSKKKMQTTRFEPKELLADYVAKVHARLRRAGMTCRVENVGDNVKFNKCVLDVAKPHSGGYDPRYGSNYRIEGNEAVSTMGGFRIKLKKSRLLNYDDWVRFNTIVNEVADEMGVSFNLKAAKIVIREGTRWGDW